MIKINRIYQKLKNESRFNEVLILFLFTLSCFSFSMFRVSYSESNIFLFLNWNLFLAIVPYMLTTIVVLNKNLQKKKWITGLVLLSWLLFFPNAPYILTDLFHLRLQLNMPIWFDLLLILSFAWTALLYGFLSLRDIETLLHNWFKKSSVNTLLTILLFAAAFGIYLGRYLRWNSWDILYNPFALVFDIGDRFLDPFSHPRTWGLTLFMGVFLNMIYWSVKLLKINRSAELKNLIK